jgi:hypothetical protein
MTQCISNNIIWSFVQKKTIDRTKVHIFIFDSSFFLSFSPTALLPSTDHASVVLNNETLLITFSPPLPQVGINITASSTPSTSGTKKRDFHQTTATIMSCAFGNDISPALVLDSNTIQCSIIQSFSERTVNLSVLYKNYPLASPVPFTYVCT